MNSYANYICTGGEDNRARGCEGHAFSQSVVVEGCVDSDGQYRPTAASATITPYRLQNQNEKYTHF